MVAKTVGIPPSKLQRVATYEIIDGITTRVILYFAEAIHKTSGTVLDELIALNKENAND